MAELFSAITQMAQENPTLNLLMLMVIVWTTGVICRIIHQPPVLGELTAGIISGPAFLGLIAPNEMLRVLSELGVFFLMFYLKFVGRHTWRLTIMLTLGLPVFVFCLFEWALTIPLPKEITEPWFYPIYDLMYG